MHHEGDGEIQIGKVGGGVEATVSIVTQIAGGAPFDVAVAVSNDKGCQNPFEANKHILQRIFLELHPQPATMLPDESDEIFHPWRRPIPALTDSEFQCYNDPVWRVAKLSRMVRQLQAFIHTWKDFFCY